MVNVKLVILIVFNVQEQLQIVQLVLIIYLIQNVMMNVNQDILEHWMDHKKFVINVTLYVVLALILIQNVLHAQIQNI